MELYLFSNVPFRELIVSLAGNSKQSLCYLLGGSDAPVSSFSCHEGFTIIHYSCV